MFTRQGITRFCNSKLRPSNKGTQTLAENKLCDRRYQYIHRDIFVAYNIKAKKNNRRLLWFTELYPDISVMAKTRDTK